MKKVRRPIKSLNYGMGSMGGKILIAQKWQTGFELFTQNKQKSLQKLIRKLFNFT